MKKFILAIATVTMLLSSCDEWLEATSSTQINASDLLNTREGLQDALSGIYIDMGSTGSYGSYNTFVQNDLAAYPYNYMSTSSYKNWQQHIYTYSDCKSFINSGWKGNYNVIANINFLIRELPARKGLLSDLEYRLYMGELLGLRAFVHFDMLRMFGVAEWDATQAEKVTIPYVTQYSAQATAQLNYEKTAALLHADVDSALVLLNDDPVKGSVPSGWNKNENYSGFWNNRTKHLNYYAVKALKMRVAQWENDFEQSGLVAGELISELKASGAVKWIDPEAQRVITDESVKDWSFSTEHIFSLECTTLESKYYGFLMTDLVSDGEKMPYELVDNILYPASEISAAEDLRGPSWMLMYTAKGYNCYKLYQPTGYYSAYRQRIPIIKLPELYYVLAESSLSAQDTTSALSCLDTVRKYRGITDPLAKTSDAVTELAKELYREYPCEGQIFYWLKHSHLKYQLYDSFLISDKDLIYPYPEDETTYGRKQEL